MVKYPQLNWGGDGAGVVGDVRRTITPISDASFPDYPSLPSLLLTHTGLSLHFTHMYYILDLYLWASQYLIPYFTWAKWLKKKDPPRFGHTKTYFFSPVKGLGCKKAWAIRVLRPSQVSVTSICSVLSNAAHIILREKKDPSWKKKKKFIQIWFW